MSGIARALETADPNPQQALRDSDGPDLLTQQQVCRKLGICDQTWMNWRRAGRTPEPVTLPSGRLKWRADAVDAMAGKPKPRVVRSFPTVRGVR